MGFFCCCNCFQITPITLPEVEQVSGTWSYASVLGAHWSSPDADAMILTVASIESSAGAYQLPALANCDVLFGWKSEEDHWRIEVRGGKTVGIYHGDERIPPVWSYGGSDDYSMVQAAYHGPPTNGVLGGGFCWTENGITIGYDVTSSAYLHAPGDKTGRVGVRLVGTAERGVSLIAVARHPSPKCNYCGDCANNCGGGADTIEIALDTERGEIPGFIGGYYFNEENRPPQDYNYWFLMWQVSASHAGPFVLERAMPAAQYDVFDLTPGALYRSQPYYPAHIPNAAIFPWPTGSCDRTLKFAGGPCVWWHRDEARSHVWDIRWRAHGWGFPLPTPNTYGNLAPLIRLHGVEQRVLIARHFPQPLNNGPGKLQIELLRRHKYTSFEWLGTPYDIPPGPGSNAVDYWRNFYDAFPLGSALDHSYDDRYVLANSSAALACAPSDTTVVTASNFFFGAMPPWLLSFPVESTLPTQKPCDGSAASAPYIQPLHSYAFQAPNEFPGTTLTITQ